MKGVHILDVLAKTPGLYHVPELRNLFIYIFWGVWGDWGGQICGEWSRMKGVHILDVLAKTPALYLVPDLRYPFHCCCPCRCPPPHYHPPHCHHHDVVVLDVLTKTPALYLVPTQPITLTTFALITSNSLKFIPTCTHSHKYNYEYFVLVIFRSEVCK